MWAKIDACFHSGLPQAEERFFVHIRMPDKSTVLDAHDTVGEFDNTAIVRHEDHSPLALVSEILQEPHERQAAFPVQGCGGFVGEDDQGLTSQRASDRDALFLPAAEIRRIGAPLRGEPDLIEELGRPSARLAPRHALEMECELDVLRCREGLEQVEPLEDKAGPDGPINSTSSPLSTSRSTASRARKAVLPSPYVFVTFRTEIAPSMQGPFTSP